jgi:hypothetical protein
MTQKIFDTDNAEDMALLWSILPDWAEKIKKSSQPYNYDVILSGNENYAKEACIFKINWHDKTEITRPMPEATEADAGKLCMFWNNDGTKAYGVLSDLITSGIKSIKYGCCYGKRWTHARRLTKQEIEELI